MPENGLEEKQEKLQRQLEENNMNKKQKKLSREKRVRSKIKRIKTLPRLTVFRSNTSIYAQIIDDRMGKTLVSASGRNVNKSKESLPKTGRAKEVGLEIAKKALAQKIKKVVFDRGRYAYHGRVKELAAGAREGGLEF